MSSKSRLKAAFETIMASGTLDSDTLSNLTEEERRIVQKLYDEGLAKTSHEYIDGINVDDEWEMLSKELARPEKKVVPLWKSVLKYAAVFIALLGIAFIYKTVYNSDTDLQITEDMIVLKLGDDNVQIIDLSKKQQILNKSGELIAEQDGDKIKYLASADIDGLSFNELNIPNGKMFEIELSDGTQVHINSGSKIKYPVKFLEGQKREVFIEGEAYFKVTKDKKHPFVVRTDSVSVEVLGTEFNISSYPEDSEIKTVLIEGSVNMANTFVPNDNIILKPGNKGSWHKTEHLTTLEEVDVNIYTGWMRGELYFDNTRFEDMTKKLERKYNVRITNKNPILAQKILTAKFSAQIESIEDVLTSIREIYPFDYKITNNQILIF
ncbi:FecR family protein [Maribacter thermophilus]|uniref:FecR family protein n=1 Tax=Maribacter thermophilus TaxID=1197874 RepID=UPI00069A9D73|nr:FecR domain-containing protein [Maribacter thermophilus]